MQHNEFQRLLIQQEIPEQLRIPLMILFEQQVELAKQNDQCVTLLTSLTQTVGNFTELHERTQEGLQRLLKHGKPDGVDVRSEGID